MCLRASARNVDRNPTSNEAMMTFFSFINARFFLILVTVFMKERIETQSYTTAFRMRPNYLPFVIYGFLTLVEFNRQTIRIADKRELFAREFVNANRFGNCFF